MWHPSFSGKNAFILKIKFSTPAKSSIQIILIRLFLYNTKRRVLSHNVNNLLWKHQMELISFKLISLHIFTLRYFIFYYTNTYNFRFKKMSINYNRNFNQCYLHIRILFKLISKLNTNCRIKTYNANLQCEMLISE